MGIFSKRLPQRNEIISVFGVVIFVVCSWSVREFLYKIPAFVLYYSVWEIFSVFSYMMAFALLESTAVTILLIVSAFVLPSKLLKEGFAYKGFLAVIIASVLSIWLQGNLVNEFPSRSLLLEGAGSSLAIFILLSFLFHKVVFLQNIVIALVDRLGILMYLYVPLGVLGILVYLLRNLLNVIHTIG